MVKSLTIKLIATFLKNNTELKNVPVYQLSSQTCCVDISYNSYYMILNYFIRYVCKHIVWFMLCM